MIGDDGLLDHDAIADSVINESDGTTKLNSIPASTSTASPIIVSSDNGKILSSHYHDLLCSRFIHASHPLYTLSFDQFHLFQMTIPQMMMSVLTKMIVWVNLVVRRRLAALKMT